MTRLEFERRKRRLSQRELGERLNYSKHPVSLLERSGDPKRAGRRLRAALESFFGEDLETLLREV